MGMTDLGSIVAFGYVSKLGTAKKNGGHAGHFKVFMN
jgi:hypothetical protein